MGWWEGGGKEPGGEEKGGRGALWNGGVVHWSREGGRGGGLVGGLGALVEEVLCGMVVWSTGLGREGELGGGEGRGSRCFVEQPIF